MTLHLQPPQQLLVTWIHLLNAADTKQFGEAWLEEVVACMGRTMSSIFYMHAST